MGAQLMAMYEEANAIGGFPARVKLSMYTKMGSAQAESYPDTPEHLQLFRDALARVRGEYSGKQVAVARSNPRLALAYAEIMSQRASWLADPSVGHKKVTETAAKALDVERASIWRYDPERRLIRCVDLYSQKTADHSSGIELSAKDFPAYFTALETERTIAAHDAHTDSRTSVFSVPYLTPLGINSMLDVPFWVKGKMLGVLCHEHTGPKRQWTSEEEEFAYKLGSIVSLMAEKVPL